MELVNLADGQIGRYTFRQVEHIGYGVSGSLGVVHDDGSEADVMTGDVYRISPGHGRVDPGRRARGAHRVPGCRELLERY